MFGTVDGVLVGSQGRRRSLSRLLRVGGGQRTAADARVAGLLAEASASPRRGGDARRFVRVGGTHDVLDGAQLLVGLAALLRTTAHARLATAHPGGDGVPPARIDQRRLPVHADVRVLRLPLQLVVARGVRYVGVVQRVLLKVEDVFLCLSDACEYFYVALFDYRVQVVRDVAEVGVLAGVGLALRRDVLLLVLVVVVVVLPLEGGVVTPRVAGKLPATEGGVRSGQFSR